MKHLNFFSIYFPEWFYLFIFRERRGREKESKRIIDVWEKYWSVASRPRCNQEPGPQPSTWPDWESQGRPLALGDDAQSPEPCWSGLY